MRIGDCSFTSCQLTQQSSWILPHNFLLAFLPFLSALSPAGGGVVCMRVCLSALSMQPRACMLTILFLLNSCIRYGERKAEHSLTNSPSLQPTSWSTRAQRTAFVSQLGKGYSGRSPTCFLSMQDPETSQFYTAFWFSFQIFPQVYSDQLGQRKCHCTALLRVELHEA